MKFAAPVDDYGKQPSWLITYDRGYNALCDDQVSTLEQEYRLLASERTFTYLSAEDAEAYVRLGMRLSENLTALRS